MDEAGRLGIKDAAEGHDGQQGDVFYDTEPEWVEVDVKRVRTERCRRFGDAWIAVEIMKKLGLPELLDGIIPKTHEKIRWSALAQILVVSRFCEPTSELFIAEQFYRQSALADLFGISEGDIYDNRLYRALDKLVEQKDKIQEHLKNRLGRLFNLTYDILLYDVTSTYFEGEAEANPKAARGYSRDSRPDCKQVCIGLVVTKEGFPFGYEIFEGNKHDSKTVETIIEKMESLYGKSDRIWIMDRGMVSPDNLELLSSEGRRYIIGTPKAQLRKFEKELLSGDWQKVHVPSELFMCRDAARRQRS
jgi:transposase